MIPILGSSVAHDPEAEVLDRFHDRHELVQIHRLGNVPIGVEVVALQHVVFVLRGRQNHHRDALQVIIGFDLGQHLTTIFLGKVEVQHDKVWAWGAGIGHLSAQIGQYLHAIIEYR